jgi:hypothetical protein
MHRVRQEDLPFVGSSHQFVGADQGNVNVSVFLLRALPGRGRDLIDIPTTRSSSSAKAAVAMW